MNTSLSWSCFTCNGQSCIFKHIITLIFLYSRWWKAASLSARKSLYPTKQETDFDVKQNTQIKDSAAVRDKPISLKSMHLILNNYRSVNTQQGKSELVLQKILSIGLCFLSRDPVWVYIKANVNVATAYRFLRLEF